MLHLMTQAEFARHRGVQRSAVSNWKKAGLLVMAEDPADGRIKVDAARSSARINGRVDPGRGRPPASIAEAPELPIDRAPPSPGLEPVAPGGAPDSLQTVRLELIRQQTAGHVLKNAQAAGELAPVAELQQRAIALGRAMRDRMQAWFRGEAERLAAERDTRTVMMIGEEGIDRVFADLADMTSEGAFDDDDEPDEAEIVAIEGEEEAGEAA